MEEFTLGATKQNGQIQTVHGLSQMVIIDFATMPVESAPLIVIVAQDMSHLTLVTN